MRHVRASGVGVLGGDGTVTDPIVLVVPGNPLPKERPKHGKGRTFTPKVTRDAEQRVRAAFWQAHPNHVPLTGDLRVEVEFHRRTRHWVDTDNLLKLVTDALNGVAYVDDKQISRIEGERFLGAGEYARTVVRIEVRDEGEQG